MLKTLFLSLTLSTALLSYAQDANDISWVMDHLKNRVQVEGQTSKTYTVLQRMELYNIPGVSIAIARDGKLVYAKGFGTANSATGTEVTTSTLFQAASISKPLAALAVLKLVDEGKIDLDADVNTYLTSWKIPENEFTKDEKVTLRRILSHTAGINVHGFPGYKPKDDFPSTLDVLTGKGNTPAVTVDTIPGAMWRYSGGGYTVMQQIVKDVSGLELDEYMEQFILPELGMTGSTFQQPIDAAKAALASGAYTRKGKLYKGVWHNYPEIAAAGLWTTPSELIAYCFHIQNSYSGKIEGVVSKELVTEMLTPVKNNWGLGPELTNEGDSLRFGHGGKNAGFTNTMIAFAHKGDALVIMTNGDSGSLLFGEITRAVSAFYGWNISNFIKVKPIEIDEKELSQFTGEYSFMQNGKRIAVKAKLKNGELTLKVPAFSIELHLTPLSATEFIDLENGTTIDFTINEAGEVTEFLRNKQWVSVKDK